VSGTVIMSNGGKKGKRSDRQIDRDGEESTRKNHQRVAVRKKFSLFNIKDFFSIYTFYRYMIYNR